MTTKTIKSAFISCISSFICGAACAINTDNCTMLMSYFCNGLTSLIVPSTLEICAIATIFVLSLIVCLISLMFNSPSAVIGINFNVAFYALLTVAKEQYWHDVPFSDNNFIALFNICITIAMCYKVNRRSCSACKMISSKYFALIKRRTVSRAFS